MILKLSKYLMSSLYNIPEQDNLSDNLKSLGLSENDVKSFSDNDFNKVNSGQELNEFEILKNIPKKKFSQEVEPITEFWNKSVLDIQKKIEVHDEVKLYSHLSHVPVTKVFFTPENYFDNLSYQIKNRLTSDENIVSEKLNIFSLISGNALKYGFSVLLMIVFIGIYILNQNNGMSQNDCQSLSCIEKNEIVNATIIQNFSNEQLYELLDEQNVEAEFKYLSIINTSLVSENENIDNLSTNFLMEEL